MRNKFNNFIVISKDDLSRQLRSAEAKGNQNLTDAHRKILSKISGYIDRFKNEPNLERGNIVFILENIIK